MMQGPYDDELGYKTVPTFSAAKIGGKMARGAGLGAVVFFGPVLAIWVLAVIGTYLPPESRDAPDPTPNSFGLEDDS